MEIYRRLSNPLAREKTDEFIVTFSDPRGGTFQRIIRARDQVEAEDMADFQAGAFDFRGPRGEAPRRISVDPHGHPSRIVQAASSIRTNIYDTISEHGGDPYKEGVTTELLNETGWDSWAQIVEAHKEDAFEIWKEHAPKMSREKLRALFLKEWPTIQREV